MNDQGQQYNRTIIIECNSNDRLSSEQNSNDFTVPTPQINIPRGSTIELDGCIVEEASAGNDSIIELSNQNVAKDKPYTSSWSLLEMRYYINNSAQNSICHPAIQNVYCNLIGDTRSSPEWGDKERFPYETCYVIPYKGMSIRIDQISGPTPTTYNTASATNNPNNESAWAAHGRGVFGYSNPTFVSWNPTGGSGGTGDWNNFGSFNIAPNPTPVNYSQNAGGFIGVVGIKSALKKNMPDSSKFTYMKPGWQGPDVLGTDDLNELSIFTDNVEINLQNDLLETPDELAILVNNQLQGSQVNNKNNLKEVKSHIRQWSLDFDGESDLYPKGSYLNVTNISSKTLINIPANFQHSESSKVYGEGFFVKDPQRWIGGVSLLKSCNNQFPLNGGMITMEGNDPQAYRFYFNATDWGNIFNLTPNNNSASYSRFMPCIQAISMLPSQLWIYPILYTDGSPGTAGQWTDEAPPGVQNPSEIVFFDVNPNGDPVNTTNEFNVMYCRNAGSAGLDTYWMCNYAEKQGSRILNLFPAALDVPLQKVFATGDPAEYYIDFGHTLIGHNQLSFISYETGESYTAQFATLGGSVPIAWQIRTHSMFNGLPYIALSGSTGGGAFGKDDLSNQAQVDEFLAIPKGFLIGTNIKTRGVYSTQSLRRLQDFFRRNERYAGSKTTYKEQQDDVENWYVDLDPGFADDFNNAYSNWMSSKSFNVPSAGDYTDFTIYDEEQNFSIIPPYYSNIWSEKQYVGNNPITAGNVGFNFRNPLTIYPISRYASMGCNHRSNENYIRVHSRWYRGILDDVKLSNLDLNYTWDWGSYGKKPFLTHPSVQFSFPGYVMENGPKYNLAFAICQMPDGQETFAFINFRDTFKGTGEDQVLYDLDKLDSENNWRQCFRLLHCCPMGFDPASTTNPFISSMNNNQTTAVNPMLEVRDFLSIRKTGQSTYQPQELEDPVYSQNIVYSGRVEDYTPFIFIGAVAPTLSFNNSRMEFSSLFTPRQFNSIDADGNQDPNIGTKICYFNDPCYQFPMLNNTIGSITNVGPINPDGTAGTVPPNAINLPGDYQQVRNKGFSDSLSGIGIENIYVRGENITSTTPGDKGVLKCSIDENDKTYNYFGSLFNLFGFDFRQFKPYYGFAYNRYSQSNYNNILNKKYEGINFFTVNAFINQSNMQNINIYGPNYLALNPSTGSIPIPPGVGGQPAFGLGYVGFQPTTIQVETDRLRSENLPSKLQNAFYMIYSNLPNCRYITNNGELNIAGYFYRQYKSGNFYFTYPTSYQKTITQDFQLSNIRLAILNSNGKPAENIGQKVSAFFKITIPTTLPNLDQQTAEEYFEASENPQMNESPLNDISNLTPIQLASLPSLGNNLATANPNFIIPETFDPDDDGPIIVQPAEGGIPEVIRGAPDGTPMAPQPFIPSGPETKQQEEMEIIYDKTPITVSDTGPVIQAEPVRKRERPTLIIEPKEKSSQEAPREVEAAPVRSRRQRSPERKIKIRSIKYKSGKEITRGRSRVKTKKKPRLRFKKKPKAKKVEEKAKRTIASSFKSGTGTAFVDLSRVGKPGVEKVMKFEGGKKVREFLQKSRRGIRTRKKAGIKVQPRARTLSPRKKTLKDLPPVPPKPGPPVRSQSNPGQRKEERIRAE